MRRRNVRVYVNDFAFKTAAPLFRLMITADKDVSSAGKRGAELARNSSQKIRRSIAYPAVTRVLFIEKSVVGEEGKKWYLEIVRFLRGYKTSNETN